MTRAAGLTIIALLLLTPPADAQVPTALSLREAIARALEANRTLLASRRARAVGLAERDVAGQRPNPEVSVEAEKETPHWAFAGTLPLELYGKRQRRIDVAQASLAVSDAEIARTTSDVLSDVRRAYYQVVASLRRVEVARELETIAGRARDAAQERYQTGAAPRLEALQSQLALAQAQNDSTTVNGALIAARAELNALLAYPTDAAFTLADPLEAGALPTLDEALRLAVEGNTDLQVLNRQIDEGRARVALAHAMRHPDPSVTGTFVYDSKPDFTYGWRLGGAIALPILTTGRADVAVAQGNLDRSVAERDARQAQIAGAVASAVSRAASARQAVLRYQNDILPSSVQVEQMADESYRSGQTGLPALLQTIQASRQIRLNALQAGLDYQVALADLERAIGTPLK